MSEALAEEVRSSQAEFDAARAESQAKQQELDKLQRDLVQLQGLIERHLAELPTRSDDLFPEDPLVVAWKERKEALEARKHKLVRLRDEKRDELVRLKQTAAELERAFYQKQHRLLNLETREARDQLRDIEKRRTAAEARVAKCEADCARIDEVLRELAARLENDYPTDEEQADFEAEKERLTKALRERRLQLGAAKGDVRGLALEGLKAVERFNALAAATDTARRKARGERLAEEPVGGLSAVS